MLPKRLILLIGLLYVLNGYTQIPFDSGESFALANITSVGNNNNWYTNGNSAQLANFQTTSFQFSQALPYGIVNLSQSHVAASTSINNNSAIGLQFQRNGHQLISYSQVGLSYGLKINKQFSGGIKLKYHRWNQGEGYPTTQTFSPEIGLLADITNTIQIGTQVQLNASRTNPFKNEVDVLKIGVKYQVESKLTFFSELINTNTQQQFVLAGYYQIHNEISIMLGTGINPGLYSFGFTWHKSNNFQMNVASQWQPILGFTPGIGILYIVP